MKTKPKSKGAILLLTTILLFVLLGMVVSLSYVTVMEQKMSGKTKSSVGSFYSAESGVEWALNKIANSSGTISSAFSTSGFDGQAAKCPASFGTDVCKVLFLDQDGKVLATSATIDQIKAVRSVGSQGGETQRAIEAAVAATGGGCYVDYSLPTGTAIGADCGAGFKVLKSAGLYGDCNYSGGGCATGGYCMAYFLPPSGKCPASGGWAPQQAGEAFVCCL